MLISVCIRVAGFLANSFLQHFSLIKLQALLPVVIIDVICHIGLFPMNVKIMETRGFLNLVSQYCGLACCLNVKLVVQGHVYKSSMSVCPSYISQ